MPDKCRNPMCPSKSLSAYHDVGKFLAHLRWSQRAGRERHKDIVGDYYQELREAPLERFGWTEQELAYREAICLFRICANIIRRPQEDWSERLQAGLQLVNETLG